MDLFKSEFHHHFYISSQNIFITCINNNYEQNNTYN